jgi:hypothetical protein
LNNNTGNSSLQQLIILKQSNELNVGTFTQRLTYTLKNVAQLNENIEYNYSEYLTV